VTWKFVVATALFALPLGAAAHLTGQTFEKSVGDTYLIDVGCDSLEFVAGQENFCDFSLIENPTSINWGFANFDEVWVKISPDSSGGEPFLKDMKLDTPIPAYMSYAFPSGGKYTLAVRFLQRGNVLAETTFPLTVLGSTERTNRSTGAILGIAIVVGCGLLLLIATFRSFRSSRSPR
jgi:hypothetical protein